MTCREFIEFLMEYLSGKLGLPEQQKFDRHVGACPACQAYLDNYKKTVAMGKKAYDCEEEPVPEDVPEDLVKAILDAKEK